MQNMQQIQQFNDKCDNRNFFKNEEIVNKVKTKSSFLNAVIFVREE